MVQFPSQSIHIGDSFKRGIVAPANGALIDVVGAAATVSSATGGGTDKIFFENDITVSSDYTITTNKNAITGGPVTINTGVTVTVPSGSTWTIV